MTVRITEAVKAEAPTGARTRIVLITPGWGSSGYYSAETLEQAAADKVFPINTQMHIDHEKDGGVGSVSTLAARLAEDAYWDPNYVDPDTGVKGGLVAENEVFTHKREMLKEMKDVIGTSIAAAAEISMGEAEGRTGRIIERLVPSPLNRVDYVTVAGRGGRISEVLESYAGNVTEMTANDTMTALSAAIRDAYQEEGSWVWVLDYDDTNVWFSQEGPDNPKTWQQGYTIDGATATLSGELIEVRRVTTYTPVTPTQESKDSAPNPAAVTENQEEATMATIDDKELADLRESAGRATVAEADITKANERATAIEAALQESNDEAATELVKSALESAGLQAPKLAARLAEGYPVKENGVIDRAKLSKTVAESIAELQVAGGAGSVRGVGDTKEDGKPAGLTVESATEAILAHRGITQKGA